MEIRQLKKKKPHSNDNNYKVAITFYRKKEVPKRYFPNVEELRVMSVEYVVLNFGNFAEQHSIFEHTNLCLLS